MRKVVFGLILGGVLGIFDGLTALFTAPETAPLILVVVTGSTIKGLIAGAITGYFAKKVDSALSGVLFGLVVGALFAWLATLGGPYFWKVIIPGAIMGMIVGYATQRYPGGSPTAPTATPDFPRSPNGAALGVLLLLAAGLPAVAAESGRGEVVSGNPIAAPPGEEVSQEFIDSLRQFHDSNKRKVIEVASGVDEELYAYRPTPEVRSFGQLIGHIADTLYFACAKMRGEPNPNEKDHRPGVVAEDSIEHNRTTKSELLAAATGAFEYCDEAFTRLAAGTTDTGPPEDAAFGAALAVYHTGLHYGNVVTYMRLNDLVPP